MPGWAWFCTGHGWLRLYCAWLCPGAWLGLGLCLAVPGPRLGSTGAVPGCVWLCLCRALGKKLGCAWVLLAVLSGAWLCLVGAVPGCAWGLPRLCWGCDWVCLAWPAWAALGARCSQLHVGHACAGMELCLAVPGWAWTTSGCNYQGHAWLCNAVNGWLLGSAGALPGCTAVLTVPGCAGPAWAAPGLDWGGAWLCLGCAWAGFGLCSDAAGDHHWSTLSTGGGA